MSKQLHDPNNIRIVQHNCNRSSNVILTILSIAEKTADIVLLQEPGFSDIAYATTHPNFELLVPPRNNRKYNRTAAYISKSNPYLLCSPRPDLSNDPDLQIIEVSTPTIPTTTIINIYNEHEGASNLYTIPRTLIHTNLPARCIIAGDMNAHHPWWNSTHPPARAEELVHLMELHNYSLLNTPDLPTFFRRTNKRPSTIDLTFVSPQVEEDVINWAIDDEAATGSDHATIRFQLISHNSHVPLPASQPRHNWNKADWDLFSNHLSARAVETYRTWYLLHQNPSHQNLDSSAELLRDLIHETIYK